jgi:pyruvate formate lyase activating enzyme
MNPADIGLSAPILDIQRFSVHDGPGVRTTIFFKGCNLRCAWCQNPESQDPRPIIGFYAQHCLRCFVCETECAERAIRREDQRIDQGRCTRCGTCVATCPATALKRMGEYLTPEALLDRILVDKPYFSSGGGVTLSGGEPMLCPDFVARFLELARADGLHCCLETAGFFDFARCSPALDRCNLVYFDLKLFDPRSFAENVGGGQRTILANASTLVREGYPVEFRMPVIPGYTDDAANVNALISFLRELGRDRVHLLRYHNMGEAKIDVIQGDQPKLNIQANAEASLQAVAGRLRQAGYEVLGAASD